MSFPFASRSVAESSVRPRATSVVEFGFIITDATIRAGPTVTVAVPLAFRLALPLVAVIVALPRLTPVTTANGGLLRATVATAGALLVQVTSANAIVFPAASRTVAARKIVSPDATVAEIGETVTDAGLVLTVTDSPLLTSPTLAVTRHPSSARAVSSPVGETVSLHGS